MSAHFDEKRGTWYVQTRILTAAGKKSTTKRGFKTQEEAMQWEKDKMEEAKGGVNEMSFSAFCDLYLNDIQGKIKKNTWDMKKTVIDKRIIPFFGRKRMKSIQPQDIVQWQEALQSDTEDPVSEAYLRTIQSQMVAIFNHAKNHYAYTGDPMSQVERIGNKNKVTIKIWTPEQYLRFIDTQRKDTVSFFCFQLFFWGGLRLGEVMALTPDDFDPTNNSIDITKAAVMDSGTLIVSEPKTPTSYRKVKLPVTVANQIHSYVKQFRGERTDQLFPFTKSTLQRNMKEGSAKVGLPQIRIQDLRHSHVAMLIDHGANVKEIGKRIGQDCADVASRYQELFPDRGEKIIEGMDDYARRYRIEISG